MKLCDCCGCETAKRTTVQVGLKNQTWQVCDTCKRETVPRIPKTSAIPLLSAVFDFGRKRK